MGTIFQGLGRFGRLDKGSFSGAAMLWCGSLQENFRAHGHQVQGLLHL